MQYIGTYFPKFPKMEENKKTPICRVCLDQIGDNEKCFNIFQKYEDMLSPDDNQDNTLIASKIIALTKVEITEGDSLPNRICSNCFLELDVAYKFKRKCEKSDDILRIANRYDSVSQEQEDIKQEHEFDNDYLVEDEILSELQQSDESDTLDIENIKAENESNQPDDKNCENMKPTDKDSPKLEVEVATKDNQVKKSKAIDLKLECHDCGNLFKSKCKMRVHWKKEHKTKFTCPNCKLQFKTYKAFQNHLEIKPRTCINASKMRIEGEGKSLVFYCKECDYSSKSRQSVVQHFIVHSKNCTFSCDLCAETFVRAQTLKHHKERIHKEYLGQTTCHVCGLVVQGKYYFMRHMRSHKRHIVRVQCDICKKVLNSKVSLIDHIRRHNGIKSYTCNICSGTFYSASALHHHKKKHGERKYFICKICGYKSFCPYKIKGHEQKHNSSNVACGVCGKFMESINQLSLHQDRHVNRPHTCEYCNNTFYRRRGLLTHLRERHNDFISITGHNKIDKTGKREKNTKQK